MLYLGRTMYKRLWACLALYTGPLSLPQTWDLTDRVPLLMTSGGHHQSLVQTCSLHAPSPLPPTLELIPGGFLVHFDTASAERMTKNMVFKIDVFTI